MARIEYLKVEGADASILAADYGEIAASADSNSLADEQGQLMVRILTTSCDDDEWRMNGTDGMPMECGVRYWCLPRA
jgi:hypothetical protein